MKFQIGVIAPNQIDVIAPIQIDVIASSDDIYKLQVINLFSKAILV